MKQSRKKPSNPEQTSSAGSIHEILKSRRRELHLIRLLLALGVLVSHSWPLGGFGSDPSLPTLGIPVSLGGFCVGGFFAISGMLITLSADRSTLQDYLLSRFLRIWPAFAVVMFFTAFVLGPILFLLAGNGQSELGNYFTFQGGPFAYFLHNISIPVSFEFGIHDLFKTNTPYGLETGRSITNGSLWSLGHEVRAYALTFVLVSLARKLGMDKVYPPVIVALLLAYLGVHQYPALAFALPEFIAADTLNLLFVFFFAGYLAVKTKNQPLNPRWVALAAVAFCISAITGGPIFSSIGFATICVLIPFLLKFAKLPKLVGKIFESDLSYGTYLWAFVVQQTLISIFEFKDVVLYILCSATLTLFLAALSWFAIEKPCLSRNKRVRA